MAPSTARRGTHAGRRGRRRPAAITAELEREGVEAFAASYRGLLACIEQRVHALRADSGVSAVVADSTPISHRRNPVQIHGVRAPTAPTTRTRSTRNPTAVRCSGASSRPMQRARHRFGLLLVTPITSRRRSQRSPRPDPARWTGCDDGREPRLLATVLRSVAPAHPLMSMIDPMEPGRRLTGVSRRDSEVASLTRGFNSMLDRLEVERRDSGRRAVAAQEHVQSRIARELHDEIGQTLTAIAIQAENGAAMASDDEREAWSKVASLAHQSLDDVRRIGRDLRPEALDDLGLVNALIALCTRIGEQSDVEIERRLAGGLPATLGRGRPRHLPGGPGEPDQRNAPRASETRGGVPRAR